jgi:diguanylate cyclase (GGDEF)-like protein/PAS domain S-box-containing protein
VLAEITGEDNQPVSVEIVASPLDRNKHLYLVELSATGENTPYKEISMHADYSRELFDQFPDAMVILNDDSVIIDTNSSFEALFGYKRKETIGCDIDELVNKPENRETGRQLFQRVIADEKVVISAERQNKAGEVVNVAITGFPVEIDKYTRGNCVIYKDISSTLQHERILKEREQFIDQLFNQSLYPIAILDCQETILNVNQEFVNLFGFRKEELIGGSINDFIIPEQYRVQAEAYRKTIFTNKPMLDQTQRMAKNGELIDVEAVGSPIVIDDQIIGLFAMYRDLRGEKRALDALNRERAYFRQFFDHSPDPTVLLDDTDRVVFINPAFESLFGFKQEEAAGSYINDLIINRQHLEEANRLSNQVMHDAKTLKLESIRSTRDGRDIEVEIIAFPVFLDKDRLGAYAIYRDITERKAKEREISELAYHDSLTGIPNRLYAYESLAAKIDQARKNKGKVAIIYFDLDGFKDVNDTSGHKVGDILLSKLSARVKKHFAGKMEVCRVGGDEFLAIVDQPVDHTVESYKAQLQELFTRAFLIKGKPFRLSLSIGSAVYPEDGANLDQLIHKADSRMYFEKRINRIKRYPKRKTTTIEELIETQD